MTPLANEAKKKAKKNIGWSNFGQGQALPPGQAAAYQSVQKEI